MCRIVRCCFPCMRSVVWLERIAAKVEFKTKMIPFAETAPDGDMRLSRHKLWQI